MTIEKYVKDGKVAVLVSAGYGAGWSTWNWTRLGMLFDPVIVELVLERTQLEKQEAEEAAIDAINNKIYDYAKAKYPDADLSAVYGLDVEWVEQGVEFRIHEYDGSESIHFHSGEIWITA